MSYELNFTLVLGSTMTGLTLSAQLIDNTGTPVGGAVTSGFHEIGQGYYLWNGTIPSGFQGGVVFSNTVGPVVVTAADINPWIDENSMDLVMVESGVNARQALSIMGAVLSGVLTGNCSSGNIQIQAMDNPSTVRVTAATSNGQRTSVVLNLPS
jgi:hypothetical protein